jgi:ParB family transcriptional regulator, chromosome partitioning protein
MRHDAHYVDTLAASAATPVGRMVPIDRVDPNPDQPRQAMGDLSDLVSSLTEKGIIEPLIVRQRGERYQIIAGERRYQAAIRAGSSSCRWSCATSTTPRCSNSRSSRTSSART